MINSISSNRLPMLVPINSPSKPPKEPVKQHNLSCIGTFKKLLNKMDKMVINILN